MLFCSEKSDVREAREADRSEKNAPEKIETTKEKHTKKATETPKEKQRDRDRKTEKGTLNEVDNQKNDNDKRFL